MNVPFFGRFFSNNFDSSRIIDARLQNFVRFVIEALTLNNPGGVFDADILALTTGYNTYFGNYTTKGVDVADDMSSTIGIDEATALFVKGVRKNYNAIANVYSKGSVVYKQFFPKGLTELSKLTRINVQTVSHRMAVKAAQYQSTLGGAPFADLFAGYETSITDALKTQNQTKGSVRTVRGSVKTSRLPVENAISGAMYSVGKQFNPDYIKCATYFDFVLLFSDIPSTTTIKTGNVAGTSDMVCLDAGIVPKSIFVLKNKSDLPLSFYATHVVNGTMVGMSIDVAAHLEKIITFPEFGSADMLFLYVKNATPYSANWEVRLEEGK